MSDKSQPEVVAKLPLTVQQGNYLMAEFGHARTVDVEVYLELMDSALTGRCVVAIVLTSDTGASHTCKRSVSAYHSLLKDAVI